VAINLTKVMKTVKKGARVKVEINRLEVSKKRIYVLSRMLSDEEGFELIQIYEQSIKDARKIQKVFGEK